MWIKIYVPFKFCVGYGLDNQGIDCDSIPGRDKSFFHFQSVKTDSGAQPAFCSLSNKNSFPVSKAAEPWHWLLTSI